MSETPPYAADPEWVQPYPATLVAGRPELSDGGYVRCSRLPAVATTPWTRQVDAKLERILRSLCSKVSLDPHDRIARPATRGREPVLTHQMEARCIDSVEQGPERGSDPFGT